MSRLPLLLCTSIALHACTSDDLDTDPADAGVGGVVDASTDAGATGCTTLAFADVVLDERQDVQTIYSARLTTELGSTIPDFLVFNFININERFGPTALGEFPLDAAPNDNRSTCAECVSVFVDQATPNSEPAAVYFQSKGTMTVTQDPRQTTFFARIEGLELIEVTIDPGTLESRPVADGACVVVPDFDVALKDIPDAWTCSEELYGTGGTCNCDCGAPDPDCYCDPFMNPDCPMTIEDDCAVGTVCTLNGCAATCDMFASPPIGCEAGELCAFNEDQPVCIDAMSRVNTATVGQACADLGVLVQYCDVADTVPAGVCDDVDELCRPICRGIEGCGEGETCYTIAGGGPENGGFGYCRPAGAIPPEEWICDPDDYAEGTACNCMCGAIDPDCANDELEVLGCSEGEACVAGTCE